MKRNRSIVAAVAAVVMCSNLPAIGQLLMTFEVGQRYEFIQRDTHNTTGWPVRFEVRSKVTIDSAEYFRLHVWNYGNESEWEDVGYVAATENMIYTYDPGSGFYYVEFQKAPVGTKWTLFREHETGWDYEILEIVAVESVAVPYGTFPEAYKHRKYRCANPDNLSLGKSPDWYTWVVPSVGIVKEEDHWADHPPVIQELVDIINAGVPVYRFWSPVNKRHFYTTSETEKNKLINSFSHVWTYERIAYYALPTSGDPDCRPVYRFWSGPLKAHFYTIKESEKNKLITQFSDVWQYEGVALYAYPEGLEPAATSPVYRFWSNRLKCHFYTISATERDKLINSFSSTWQYEGVAWYAYP